MAKIAYTGNGWGGATASSSINMITSAAPPDSLVVIVVQTFQTEWPNCAGYTRYIGGGGAGAATVFVRKYTGAPGNSLVYWGATRQWCAAWTAWSGVESVNIVNNLQATTDPPNTTTGRVMTDNDMWIAAASARCTGTGGPGGGFVNRDGYGYAGDGCRLAERPGTGSASENPGSMLSGVSSGNARMGTTIGLYAIPDPGGTGFGYPMAPRMAAESLEETPRERIWIPRLHVPKTRPLLAPA